MNEILPIAQWHGPPTQETIAWILANTHTDQINGRRYYKAEDGSWRRLKTAADFAAFNAWLDVNRVHL